ncbi:FecCD family ABC transporter permease [Corynebacterium provencense]|uniref:FecCD family ABC transporter permease n=1 Tax=Corynebacterium provencense TaxID=1737425 RepID=UPI000AFD9132|nr:iron chelate uptake ABC transporter family permease subunit [Corynebacterium provencense]
MTHLTTDAPPDPGPDENSGGTSATTGTDPDTGGGGRRDRGINARRALGLIVLVVALALAFLASLAHGANPIPYADVWDAIWHRGENEASWIVWDQRLPRTVIGILTGAAFALAGALIQALTRNPLADAGILGVNAGAGLAVTVGVGVLGISGITQYIWFAFLGAAGTTVLVYVIGVAGGGRGANPATLVLAGVALGAVFGGVTSFLTLIDPDTFESIRNWNLGSVARTSLEDARFVIPFLLLGFVLAVLVATDLNSIALGDDLAASLGTRVVRARVVTVVAVTVLAGGATALTGGIGFVGLMVPHVVRWIVGPDQRWIFFYCLLGGPVMVLLADTLGRVIARPGEIEVGILTAVIGAPVLIALVRRKNASGL